VIKALRLTGITDTDDILRIAMTKVQLRYDLTRPLNEDMMEQISKVHTVYGILRVRPNEASNGLIVDYDASRLSEMEVETVLHKAGIPIVLHV
jgi:hypothetical protein